ncbi:uncharacterized protein ATC70_007255 [Mucor velutinosus]|uniref:DUF7082 domain-containing protein n=1 Tax=Mucor velutinosus TaxID=708070 RepID=A0AAN7D6D2_9FUNG|nr:hypothetical protein ATC70_007255 [Mucor velutinosus]
MMDTATNSTNEAIAIDTSFNTGFLKTSSKNYLPTGTPTNANAFSRPRVIQWDPHMGTDQSTITVVLEQAISDASASSTPTLNDEIHPMKLVFGRLVVETNQQQQRAPTASPNSTLNSQLVWITLVARVPRFEETQIGHGNQVPLSICVYDSRHSDTATDHWDFGVFTYNSKSGAAARREEGSSSSAAAAAAGEDSIDTLQGKKRGAPPNDQDFGSNKRPHTTSLQQEDDDQLFNQLLAPFDDSPGKTTSDTSTMPSLQHPQHQHGRPSQAIAPHPSPLNYSPSDTAGNAFTQPNPYSNSAGNTSVNDYPHPVNIQPSPMHQLGYNAYQSSTFTNYPSQQQQPPPQGNNTSSAAAAAAAASSSASSSLVSASAMYPNYPQQTMFSSQPVQASQQPSHSMMMSSISSKPTDASELGGGGMTTPMTAAAAGAVTEYPFAGVLSKANLKIMGDMMEMTWHWSQEEWTNGRRLVQFWRRQRAAGETSQQKDNQVECGFEAIEQEAYQQQRIRENLAAQKDGTQKKSSPLVISCIYWRERNDYYITSVDCIYLLEGLIGVQFTVEEKNRIRRNLEGFRPLTVSKCKPECADFFKLIMSFPHPKPRNIEKDVKVFSWKSLPSALTKIIRKYTPSYSSTVVANVNQ